MKKLTYLAAVAALLLPGCASFQTPFGSMRADYSGIPEEELRSFASAVEKSVLEGNKEAVFDGYTAVAASDPEVMQAIRTRAARAHLIQALLNSGHAYEEAQGTISILRTREYKNETDKRQRDQNALLVMSENSNRWTLYESLCEASNWPGKSLGAVQKSFFDARVELMQAGQKYEGPDGEPTAK